MKTNTDQLIKELIATTNQNLRFATTLQSKPKYQLHWRELPERWNILECLEHLNLYGDYYLPEIEKCIENSKSKRQFLFKSGILGNYFANSMLVKPKPNKMKTFKNKNPLNYNLNELCIDRFIEQQQKLLALLNKAQTIDLNREKIPISISKWIKLNLGDTFRFIVNHNIRHLNQIENILHLQKQTSLNN